MDRIESLCVEKGMRMTEQRRVIARVLSDSSDHPDVEAVHRRATAIDPNISIATVYRTVRLFEEAGILAKHDFGDGRARYEETPEEHHDHLMTRLSRRLDLVGHGVDALHAADRGAAVLLNDQGHG